MKEIPIKNESVDPNEWCEECHDTGWGGDHGPGWKGNDEVGPCDCDPEFRIERKKLRERRCGRAFT